MVARLPSDSNHRDGGGDTVGVALLLVWLKHLTFTAHVLKYSSPSRIFPTQPQHSPTLQYVEPGCVFLLCLGA